MHLDVAFATLFDLLTTPRLLFLMAIAVPMGVFFGSTPGLGGKLGLVLLIPFVYNMDQLTGAVFLCAMHAVVHTGGSIPSILIGVPGDGPAAATALDGYAMTKKGEAGRALGASFGASTVGGLLGAMFLGLSLPILEPIILNFSPAGHHLHRDALGRQFRQGHDRGPVRLDVCLHWSGSLDRKPALYLRSDLALGRAFRHRRGALDVRGAGDDLARRQGPRL